MGKIDEPDWWVKIGAIQPLFQVKAKLSSSQYSDLRLGHSPSAQWKKKKGSFGSDTYVQAFRITLSRQWNQRRKLNWAGGVLKQWGPDSPKDCVALAATKWETAHLSNSPSPKTANHAASLRSGAVCSHWNEFLCKQTNKQTKKTPACIYVNCCRGKKRPILKDSVLFAHIVRVKYLASPRSWWWLWDA